MDISLRDRVAVVTGGSRGIGGAIAEILAKCGAQVVVVARKEDQLKEFVNELNCSLGEVRVSWVAANVSDELALGGIVDFCTERFGYVDILVNGAAANPHFGPMHSIDSKAMKKILEVNLESAQAWISHFWTSFWRDSVRGASCINIASIGGIATEQGIGFYNVSKAALLHLTRQFASELGPRVRVNSISPGLVRTEFARALWENYESSFANKLPLGRIGEPADIAGAALFLASDLSKWVTGTNVIVDGGALVKGFGLE